MSSGSNTVNRLAAGQPTRIVCFGDSITGVYYHTGGRRAWCDALGIALTRIYPQAQVEMINAGISGNTTVDALQRLEADVLSRSPHLVVAMFGMNDVVRVPPEDYRANLQQMVQRLRAQNVDLILLTPNYVYPDDPARPLMKLAGYADIVRQTGRELIVAVADAYQAFAAVQAADYHAWIRLMSDSVHPNMRGHLLFAQETVHALTGQKSEPMDLPALHPSLPRVLARLQAGQPLRVIAMKPFDTLIGPAVQAVFPKAQLAATAWDTTGLSIAEIEAQAKSNGWPKYRDNPGSPQPDLVIVAVPAMATAPHDEPFYRSYAWILNWSQSFGAPRWDCLAVMPSVLNPDLNPLERSAEQLALEGVLDKDLPVVRRVQGDNAHPADLLATQLKSLLTHPTSQGRGPSTP